MQTLDELKYSQSVWGFQPRKSEMRKVCDVKGLLRHRNHLDVCKDRFKQRSQIVPLVRQSLKCPGCGTDILLASRGRTRYVQGLSNGKLLTFFRLSVHQCWCSMAEATDVPELAAMAKTIRSHIKGILGYWKLGGATNASMEGFNAKVRWLIKQAYGFRDFKYFRLKIFDLPSTDIRKRL